MKHTNKWGCVSTHKLCQNPARTMQGKQFQRYIQKSTGEGKTTKRKSANTRDLQQDTRSGLKITLLCEQFHFRYEGPTEVESLTAGVMQ